MRLLLLASLLSAVASAQPVPDTTAHRVPFASSGNSLELAVANAASDTALDSVTVRLVGAPAWLRFEQPQALVGRIAPGTEAIAAFAFSVDRAAPVGESAETLFRIESANGRVMTKTVRLRVEAPRVLALEAAYPNPFRTSTTLAFELPAEGHVHLSVFDVLGREVAHLLDEPRPAGRHEAVWQASGVSSGVYVYRLAVEDRRGERSAQQRRVTVLR